MGRRKEIIYVSNVPEAGIWVHKAAAQKCRKFRRQNFPIVASSAVSYHNGLNHFSEILTYFSFLFDPGLGLIANKAAQKCRKFRRQNFPIVASSAVSYH